MAASASSADTACHVVCIGYGAASDSINTVCPTLPEGAMREIRAIKPDAMRFRVHVETLRAIIRHHHLPGLALVWNATPFPLRIGARPASFSPYYLDPPPPMRVGFEPVELNERDPRLAVMLELKENERPAPAPAVTVPLSGVQRRQVALLALVVVPCILALGFILFGGLLAPGPLASRMPCFVCLVPPIAVCAGIFAASGFLRSDRWFLVPGGVVVRHAGLMRRSADLSLFRPSDTLLIIQPQPQGWKAVFIQVDQTRNRHVSGAECLALLRAWQCPLPPPSEQDLDDLR